MIIGQGGEDADHKSHAKPHRLAFDEKINVSVTITCKCARAEKHDNSDDE
jgi:hypothetical protein